MENKQHELWYSYNAIADEIIIISKTLKLSAGVIQNDLDLIFKDARDRGEMEECLNNYDDFSENNDIVLRNYSNIKKQTKLLISKYIEIRQFVHDRVKAEREKI